MLIELFPRTHARFLALPLLGPLLDGFARRLSDHGFAAQSIRGRARKAPVLEELLLERRLGDLSNVCKPQRLALTAGKPQQDRHLSALVRSLADVLEQGDLLATTVPTPGEQLANSYRLNLGQVRGLAASTQKGHRQLAPGLLDFLGFDHNPAAVSALGERQVESFMTCLATGRRLSKFQNRASFLRSSLRFLAARGEIPAGLDLCIDSPVSRAEGRCPLRCLRRAYWRSWPGLTATPPRAVATTPCPRSSPPRACASARSRPCDSTICDGDPGNSACSGRRCGPRSSCPSPTRAEPRWPTICATPTRRTPFVRSSSARVGPAGRCRPQAFRARSRIGCVSLSPLSNLPVVPPEASELAMPPRKAGSEGSYCR